MLFEEIYVKFKHVKGYYISNQGRVWSSKTEKFMSFYLHKSRSGIYPRMSIGGKKHMLHVIVAEHFCKKPKGFDQVDHDDGNTLNFNAWNLQWVDQSQNQLRQRLKNSFQMESVSLLGHLKKLGGKEKNIISQSHVWSVDSSIVRDAIKTV